MLMPQELKKHEFARAVRGYSMAEVDDYIEFICRQYEDLYRERNSLERKLEAALRQLDDMHTRQAKTTELDGEARRVSARMLADAEREKKRILKDAEEYADRLLADADAQIQEKKQTLRDMKHAVLAFRDDLYLRYGEQIDRIEAMAAVAESIPDMPTPVAPPAPEETVERPAVESPETEAEVEPKVEAETETAVETETEVAPEIPEMDEEAEAAEEEASASFAAEAEIEDDADGDGESAVTQEFFLPLGEDDESVSEDNADGAEAEDEPDEMTDEPDEAFEELALTDASAVADGTDAENETAEEEPEEEDGGELPEDDGAAVFEEITGLADMTEFAEETAADMYGEAEAFDGTDETVSEEDDGVEILDFDELLARAENGDTAPPEDAFSTETDETDEAEAFDEIDEIDELDEPDDAEESAVSDSDAVNLFEEIDGGAEEKPAPATRRSVVFDFDYEEENVGDHSTSVLPPKETDDARLLRELQEAFHVEFDTFKTKNKEEKPAEDADASEFAFLSEPAEVEAEKPHGLFHRKEKKDKKH